MVGFAPLNPPYALTWGYGFRARPCGRPGMTSTLVRLAGGCDLDRERRRDALPDVGEDALPAFAIDAGIVEAALGRPPLRQMSAAAGVQILALLAGLAQTGAGLEGFAPDRVVDDVLDRVAADMRF